MIKSKHHHVDAAIQYAKDVVDGKILSCQHVIAACSRQLKDLDRQNQKGNSEKFPYRFDPDEAERVCRFIERMPHIKGIWANQRRLIKLEPWQSFARTTIFGWRHIETGFRRFRESYSEVARKNAKSTIEAATGLYMMAGDRENGAEVYCGATTEKQAWEVFGPAKLMAQRSGLVDHLGVQVNARNINYPELSSRFEPIIGKPGDGSSPHHAIVDEYHEHATPDQYDTMITGMGARTQPLLSIATTAGVNLAGPCYMRRKYVVDVIHGRIPNEQLFGIIYTIDDDDQWEDFDNWPKANPNIGVSVFKDFLKARRDEAVQVPARQNIIQTKHLNRWLQVNVAFFDMMAWRRCEDKPFIRQLEESRRRVIVGLDLASKVDVAALVVLFVPESENERIGFIKKYYLPEYAVQKPENEHYRAWASSGRLTIMPGKIIDFSYIKEDLRKIAQQYDIVEAAYDPWQATQLATEMQSEGIRMVEVRQVVSSLSEPMKELETWVLSERLAHDGCPMTEWMASNVVAHRDAKDNVFPNKEFEERKIDGIVALIMAIGRMIRIQGAEDSSSVYESRPTVLAF